MNRPHLPDAAALLVALLRWTEFAEQCAEQRPAARDAAQQMRCSYDHAVRGVTALSELAKDQAA